MSTSAAGGGPGPGPAGTFKSMQAPVKGPTVALAVLAGAAGIYVFWEMRIRAGKKLGHTPKTLEKEWQQAEEARLRHAPFEATNPSKFAFLNPHRHDIPPSKYISVE